MNHRRSKLRNHLANRLLVLLLSLATVAVAVLGPSASGVSAGKSSSPPASLPPWVAHLAAPQGETLYLVLKGSYADRAQAEKSQKFIQQLMGNTPAEGIDLSDGYSRMPKGKYIVGMLFDTQERAQWWMEFSYRNRQVGRGTLQPVKLLKPSPLPYMPSASRSRKEKLVAESEALAQVKALPDIQRLASQKKLLFKFTDYPRNGDLRYEIEVLEDKGKRRDPVMVDFVMVNALDGRVVERLSEALGKRAPSRR